MFTPEDGRDEVMTASFRVAVVENTGAGDGAADIGGNMVKTSLLPRIDEGKLMIPVEASISGGEVESTRAIPMARCGTNAPSLPKYDGCE
jgi:hypothetical protein